jgi:hypothetical protein
VQIRGTLDALLLAEIAGKAEEIGVRKANMDTASTFVLAVLEGRSSPWGRFSPRPSLRALVNSHIC